MTDMKTYIIQDGAMGHIKIGRSADPTERIRNLQTANASRLKLIGVIDGDCEAELHERFADSRISGTEWFKPDRALKTYCFQKFGEAGRLHSGANYSSELLTVDEVKHVLKISARHVWKLHTTGQIPAPVRLGRAVRWRADDIKEWVRLGCPSRERFEATML